jgi:hypothetical protein
VDYRATFDATTQSWGIDPSDGAPISLIAAGLVAALRSDEGYWIVSPQTITMPAVSVWTTAQETGSDGSGAFGTMCQLGDGAQMVTYEFTTAADGNWQITKYTGAVTATSQGDELDQGQAAVPASGAKLTLDGVCVESSDGQLVQIELR